MWLEGVPLLPLVTGELRQGHLQHPKSVLFVSHLELHWGSQTTQNGTRGKGGGEEGEGSICMK